MTVGYTPRFMFAILMIKLKMMKRWMIALFILLGMSVQAQQIDVENSIVNFSLSNMGFRTVDGTIKGMKGNVKFDKNDLSNTSFETSVDVNTIDTESKKRDEHLKKDDFFDVANYAVMQFKSESITAKDGQFVTKGNLTIRDITKMVEIPFSVEEESGKTTLKGKLVINRKDYNVGESYGNFMVGEEVEIEIVCVLK